MTNKISKNGFVAINYIDCEPGYRERFEMLFATRAHAIDTVAGFQDMMVLRPNGNEGSYLVISHWENEIAFQGWMKSPAFQEGHKRGFADVKKEAEENRPSPMKSSFKTYEIISQ